MTMILISITNCRASKTTSLVTIERRDRKQSRAPGPSLSRPRTRCDRSPVQPQTRHPQYLPSPNIPTSRLCWAPDSYSPKHSLSQSNSFGSVTGVGNTFPFILNAVWELCETNQIKLSNGIWSFSARNVQTWSDVMTVIGCSLLQILTVIFCSDTIFCFRDYKAILDQQQQHCQWIWIIKRQWSDPASYCQSS